MTARVRYLALLAAGAIVIAVLAATTDLGSALGSLSDAAGVLRRTALPIAIASLGPKLPVAPTPGPPGTLAVRVFGQSAGGIAGPRPDRDPSCEIPGSPTYQPTTVSGGGDTEFHQSCSYPLPSGIPISLQLTLGAYSYLVGFGGACTGTGACSVVIQAGGTVSVDVHIGMRGVRVLRDIQTGSGAGGLVDVTPSGTQWDCHHGSFSVNFSGPQRELFVDVPGSYDLPWSKCVAFDAPTTVTIRATASNGSQFRGWTDSCAAFGTNPVCTLTVDKLVSTVAIFRLGN